MAIGLRSGLKGRVPLIVGACLVAAALGVVAAISVGAGIGRVIESEEPSDPLTGQLPRPRFDVAIPGDARISFPEDLEAIGGTISDIALDSEGGLWIAFVTAEGELRVSGPARDGSVGEEFSIPLSGPAPSNAHLEFDESERLIVAAGEQVVVVEPATTEYEIFDLPGVSEAPGDFSVPNIAVAMAVDDKSAFILRFGGGAR